MYKKYVEVVKQAIAFLVYKTRINNGLKKGVA